MGTVESAYNMPFVAGWGSTKASPQKSKKNII